MREREEPRAAREARARVAVPRVPSGRPRPVGSVAALAAVALLLLLGVAGCNGDDAPGPTIDWQVGTPGPDALTPPPTVAR